MALLGVNKTPPMTLVVKMVLTKKLKSPVAPTALDKVLEAVPHMGVCLGWVLLQVNGQVCENLLSDLDSVSEVCVCPCVGAMVFSSFQWRSPG